MHNFAYNHFFNNTAIDNMLCNDLFHVLRFYFTISNTRFSRTDNIYQDFFLTHTDTARLLYLNIIKFTHCKLIQNGRHHFARACSNTTCTHTYDYFSAVILTNFHVCL